MKPDFWVEKLKSTSLPYEFRKLKPVKYTHGPCGFWTDKITVAYVHLQGCHK